MSRSPQPSTLEERRDWRPNFRWRALLDQVVLTADHGTWALLSPRDFRALQAGRPSARVHDDLADKGLIRTRHNGPRIRTMRQAWTVHHRSGPFLHIVVATRRCNLSCGYCHASARPLRATRQDLKPAMGRRIVDFIVQTPAASIIIEFQGGESMLNFDTVAGVVQYAEKVGQATGKRISFTLVTNLTLMTARALRFFKQHGVSLCSSLDGPKPLHDAHRRNSRGRGSFDQVIRKLRLTHRQGLESSFLTILTRQTLPHYRKIVDFWADMGLDVLCANPVQPLGHARRVWADIACDSDAYLNYYRRLLDYMFEKMRRGSFVIDRRFSLALEKLTSCSDVRFTDFRNPCGAVFGQLAYDINGDIYPCDEARGIPDLKLGNVRQACFDEIARCARTEQVVAASIPDSPTCRRCAYKPFCGICPVMSLVETGSLRTRPPDDPRCQISMFLFDYLFSKMIREPEDIRAILRYRSLKQAVLDAAASPGSRPESDVPVPTAGRQDPGSGLSAGRHDQGLA